MTLEEHKRLSKAEWKVMKIVWELGKAMAREVYTIAGEQHGWSPPTVKTLLKRLVDKGHLSTTQIGNGFVYRPSYTAISTLRSAADTLLTNAVEGTTGPLLAHMVEQTPLSEGDLDALQKLIDSKKRSLKKRAPKGDEGAGIVLQTVDLRGRHALLARRGSADVGQACPEPVAISPNTAASRARRPVPFSTRPAAIVRELRRGPARSIRRE